MKIPTSWDESSTNNLTNIYRTSHEEIDNVEIQILDVTNQFIEARIFGQAQDGSWADDETTQEEAGMFSDIYVHCKFLIDKKNKAKW